MAFMVNNPDINLHTMPNGVRIITERIPGVRSCSLGIWVGTGSRMERDDEHGITHFIEHLMFKGTEKRSARDIAEALDSVGGRLNAFTGKETTCYYARVMEDHLPIAVDILTDMLFNATFKDEHMDMERGVIKEEISMTEDSPDELIHDYYMSMAWPDNPLGKTILGTAQTLDGIDRAKVKRYIDRQYVPDRLVIACAGSLDHERLVAMLEPVFEGMERKEQPVVAPASAYMTGVSSHLQKRTEQVQICLGIAGVSAADERNYPLNILNTVLGGGLSSRLVQTIREERGLAYSIYSFSQGFSDTGMFAMCAGTSPKTAELVASLMRDELKSVKADGITETELLRAKEQIRGGMYMGLESVSNRMNRLGRNLLLLDKIISPEAAMSKVDAVMREDIPALVETLYIEPQMLATIGPMDGFKG